MKYITHHKFKGKTLSDSNQLITLDVGTPLECVNDALKYEGDTICLVHSYVSKQHFARDDDGRGLERGALTYKIAFEPRMVEGGFRFTENERLFLCKKYPHWLKSKICTVLFNDDFFAADVDELKEFADKIFGGEIDVQD